MHRKCHKIFNSLSFIWISHSGSDMKWRWWNWSVYSASTGLMCVCVFMFYALQSFSFPFLWLHNLFFLSVLAINSTKSKKKKKRYNNFFLLGWGHWMQCKVRHLNWCDDSSMEIGSDSKIPLKTWEHSSISLLMKFKEYILLCLFLFFSIIFLHWGYSV